MKIKILFLFCVLTLSVTAQTPETAQTLFGGKKAHFGVFVSPFCQAGKIAGPLAVLPGLHAGVILNHNLSLGLSYKFIATENTPGGEADTRLYLDQFYAGLRAGYSILPNKVVHLNFEVEAGIGHTELDLKDAFENDPSGFTVTDASFAYVEPRLALEINVWKYLKLDIGAQYRFVSDVAYRHLTGRDFNGPGISTGLKIGLY
jgi:hypothetical protein